MQGDFNLIWLVLFLPLAGSIVQALFGKKIVDTMGSAKGKRLMGGLAVAFVAMPFLIGSYLTWQLASLAPEARSAIVTLYDWITIQSLRVPFEVLIDPLSMTMVLIITGIGALIHLYATAYMAEDRDYTRFFTYLNLFISAMLILVLGNNLLLMFIGWEGVGLCSYLLIGFWYKEVENAKAANKAFIVNRIGDWMLTLGMFLLMTFMVANLDRLGAGAAESGRWLSYDIILPNAVAVFQDSPGITTAIALLLFGGAVGKSAQFPLYFWLPDAMAGPTPVSALIHAATMVTAGVFLLNRMNIFFQMSPVASAVVACIGAFTALFAALIAFGQTDIKKVLAYSTVSQLGFMFIGCGVGAYWTGMFHVTTHAFFKALLFLGAGAVIYAMAHNQDLRNYGNLKKYLPITFFTMMAGYVAIAGVPFMSGFWSKESILGGALAMHHAEAAGIRFGEFAGWMGLVVAALTAMYMTRMTWLTFFGGEERWRTISAHAHHHDEHGVAAHPPHHESESPYEHVQAGAVHATIGADLHGHDHGPDLHRFFYSDEELHQLAQSEIEEHGHHDLDANHTPKEVPPSMWIPLAVLGVLSLVGGWFLYSGHRFEYWLYSPDGHLALLGEVHTHPEGIRLLELSIAAASLGIIAGILIYRRGLPKREGWDEARWHPFRRWAAQQFGYDDAMVNAGVSGGGDLATGIWRYIDVGIIDRIVNGVGVAARGLGKAAGVIQTGYIRMYALMMLLGVAGMIGFLYWLLSRGGAQ
jgi:NADH-quinone oxidoreductase subunit L